MHLLSPIKKHGYLPLFILGIGSGFFLWVFFKNAWVADDAYISFRSVEQFFAGNGLRWNSDERVQVFTSPLWFGLLLMGRIFSNNLFLVSIVLSAGCCAGALWFARKAIDNDTRWLAFVLLIAGSWAIMDFSSSGLENPLLYLLGAVFFRYFFAVCEIKEMPLRQLCFFRLLWILGFLSITRHDVATLVVIPFLYAAWLVGREKGFIYLLKNSYRVWLPFMIWTTFSIIYYGMPFPNTAYAKMLHGIPRNELMDFGNLYLNVSFRFDFFAVLAILLLTLRLLWKREITTGVVWLGVLLNLFYIAYIGGDFMLGRFISVPVFVAALVAFSPLPKVSSDVSLWWVKGRMALLLILLAITALLESPLKLRPDSGFDINEGRRHYSWNGILNERNFYFKTNSLWAYVHRDTSQPFPDHKWCKMGISAREQNKQVADFGGIGMYGYCAGLDMVVIDNLALGEPFLARLPKPTGTPWRAGHFHRDYPQGYYESRLSGNNHLVDKHLAALWEDITQLTRASLFTSARWLAIWRINTGFYKNIDVYYLADISVSSGAGRIRQATPDTLTR